MKVWVLTMFLLGVDTVDVLIPALSPSCSVEKFSLCLLNARRGEGKEKGAPRLAKPQSR